MQQNKRLQSGQVGEIQAQQWFLNNGWHMTRTQPAIEILGVSPGRRFGTVFTVRMIGRGGVPDFTGYHLIRMEPLYRACEVKEASGSSMPASRLDKDQRKYMAGLPKQTAFVGIFWTDHGKFTMHEFVEKGSYKFDNP